MEYKQHYNLQIANMVDRALKKKKYDKFFKGMIKEATMRKAYEFDMPFDEVMSEISNIYRNVDRIEFVDSDSDSILVNGMMCYGVYHYNSKLIVLNREYYKNQLLQNNQSLEDVSMALFETMVHELQHAAQDRYDGTSGLSNDRNGNYYGDGGTEVHVETISNRLVYPRDANTSQNYRNETDGYTDITFVANIMAATFGATEKEYLYYSNKGRSGIEEFLQNISKSPEEYERNRNVYSSLETNLNTLYNLGYNEKLTTTEERSELTTQVLHNIYNKSLENIDKRLSCMDTDKINSEEISHFQYDKMKVDKIMLDTTRYYKKLNRINDMQDAFIVNEADDLLMTIGEKLLNLDSAIKGKQEFEQRGSEYFQTTIAHILDGNLNKHEFFIKEYFPNFYTEITKNKERVADKMTENLQFSTKLMEEDFDGGKVWDNSELLELIGKRLLKEIKHSENIKLFEYKGEGGKTYIQGNPKQSFLSRIKNLYYSFRNRNLDKLEEGAYASQKASHEYKEPENTLGYIEVDDETKKRIENMPINSNKELSKDNSQNSLDEK